MYRRPMNLGGGGGGGGIIIVLILCCCFMVIMGLAGFWTCTGGTFNSADFDSAKCIQIPGGNIAPADGDGDGDGGGSSGANNMNTPSWDSSNPNDVEQGEDYLLCVGTIFPNDAKTCYNGAEEGAGIRWVWSDNPEATACQQKVAKWRIDVTSDSEQHLNLYTHYINTGTASSFSFNNAPSGFVTGTFVRFRISAIDVYGDLLMPSVNIELDANTSTSTCGEVGISDPVNFNNLEKSLSNNRNLSGEDTHLPPSAEPAVDCVGGEWVAVGDCLVDGSPVDKTTCGPSCTQEMQLQNITTPASGGGECITSKYVQIERESCAAYTPDPAIDCVMASLPDGSPLWTDATPCSVPCGGGTKTQGRAIIVDSENGGAACGATTRNIACNTQSCPVNCVGGWSAPQVLLTKRGSGKMSGTCQFYQTYNVTRAAAHGGTACSDQDGAEFVLGTYSSMARTSCDGLTTANIKRPYSGGLPQKS